MENQEHVLVPASETATGVVMVIWSDAEETPLEAIGRLNREVAEGRGLSVEARDEIAVALQAVEAALDAAQQVSSYASEVVDQAGYAVNQAEDAESEMESARNALTRLLEATEQVVS